MDSPVGTPATGLFPAATALYCRRRAQARNGSTGGSLTASSTLRPLRRGLALAGLVLLGAAVQACGENVTPTPVSAGEDGTLPVVLRNFAFEPKRIAFSVGETVEFRLVSDDIAHTFTVKDLSIDWEVSTVPQTQTFTFESAGTFKLICAIPGHEGSGMVGTVEVR